MKYMYLGGAGEVGASCLLIQVAGRNILIDCGVRVNHKLKASLPDFHLLQRLAPTLDAIFISHAHADHVGALSELHNMYPTTPRIMTEATAYLSNIMIKSAQHLKETTDVILAGTSKGDLFEAGAYKGDPWDILERLQLKALTGVRVITPDLIDKWIDLDFKWEGKWYFRFIPSGHILGAVSIAMYTPEGTFLYTGDVSAFNQRIVDGIGNKLSSITAEGITSDFMWCESTYGDGNHPARKTEEQNLATAVAAIIADGGKVLIPSFALGRAQEIIMILMTSMQSGTIPPFPILTDGLVNRINVAYERNLDFASKRFQHWARLTPRMFSALPITPVKIHEREDYITSDIPYCVIASSGMLLGGASVDYAKALAGNPKNAIFISGYQDDESPGGRLETLRQGDLLTFSDGEVVQINCQVQRFHLSAHSDQGQLIKMIKQVNPKQIALAHGSEDATQALHEKLSQDFPTTIPVNSKLYNVT